MLRHNARYLRACVWRGILEPENSEILKVDGREHRRKVRGEQRESVPVFSFMALELPSMTKLRNQVRQVSADTVASSIRRFGNSSRFAGAA